MRPYTEEERKRDRQKTYTFYLDDGTPCPIIRPNFREARRSYLRALRRKERDEAKTQKELERTRRRIVEYARSKRESSTNEGRPACIQGTLFGEESEQQ